MDKNKRRSLTRDLLVIFAIIIACITVINILIIKSVGNYAPNVASLTLKGIIIELIIYIPLFIFIYVFTKKRVLNPLNKIIDVANEMAKGDLNQTVPEHKRENEVGYLSDALNSLLDSSREQEAAGKKIASGDLNFQIKPRSSNDGMSLSMQSAVSSIRQIVADVDNISGQAVRGNIKVRIDVSQYNGEYRAIAQGFNNTLDSIEKPLGIGLDQLVKLAAGSDSDELENNFEGSYNEFIDRLNKTRASLLNMLTESIRLAKHAKAGDMAYRADTSELQGYYINIVQGMNDTLDAVSDPMVKSEKVLEKLANNDYTEKVEGNYEGSFKNLTSHINDVQERLVGIQNIFEKVAVGDTGLLEKLQAVGKRSENDNMMPASIQMMSNIRELIDLTKRLANAASNGDLSQRGDESKFAGGYKEIVVGLNKTLEMVIKPIQESAEVLKLIAEGDMRTEMTGDYKGDYMMIKSALNHTIESFNEILQGFSSSANQVAAGAQQVSQSSMALSQGATEQASSVQELTASLTEVAAQTQQNAKNATDADKLAEAAKNNAVKGNDQMKAMLKSMDDINTSSNNISKIIKAIDDIAFQTNILALNAAVEAARAGQHGKGFTVVAEEVRNLAAKSANAAAETAELIKSSISMVNQGTEIAKGTAKALEEIVGDVSKTADLVSNIAAASSEQSAAIEQINQGIEQVSQVVQANSATSEESAAASEELSSQAELLKEEVGKFKLKKADADKINYDSLSPDIIKKLEEMFDNKKKEPEQIQLPDESDAKVSASGSKY